MASKEELARYGILIALQKRINDEMKHGELARKVKAGLLDSHEQDGTSTQDLMLFGERIGRLSVAHSARWVIYDSEALGEYMHGRGWPCDEWLDVDGMTEAEHADLMAWAAEVMPHRIKRTSLIIHPRLEDELVRDDGGTAGYDENGEQVPGIRWEEKDTVRTLGCSVDATNKAYKGVADVMRRNRASLSADLFEPYQIGDGEHE